MGFESFNVSVSLSIRGNDWHGIFRDLFWSRTKHCRNREEVSSNIFRRQLRLREEWEADKKNLYTMLERLMCV